MGDGYTPYMKPAQGGFIVCYYEHYGDKGSKMMGGYEKMEKIFKTSEYEQAIGALVKYYNMYKEEMGEEGVGEMKEMSHNPGNGSY